MAAAAFDGGHRYLVTGRSLLLFLAVSAKADGGRPAIPQALQMVLFE